VTDHGFQHNQSTYMYKVSDIQALKTSALHFLGLLGGMAGSLIDSTSRDVDMKINAKSSKSHFDPKMLIDPKGTDTARIEVSWRLCVK
jgi:hypothetical protein